MAIVAIVQARMDSKRLPKKVMTPIGGIPMIKILLERLSQASRLDRIIVAIPRGESDESLADYVTNLGYSCYRGSESDVLDRYVGAAKHANAKIVVRITADCPLIDPSLVDQMISEFLASNVDYMSNTLVPSYPDGLDTEIFTIAALERAHSDSESQFDREHVTPYLYNSGLFKTACSANSVDLSGWRWTVDEPEDLEVVSNIFNFFAPDLFFSWQRVVEFQLENPGLFLANAEFCRNDGSNFSSGQKLWKRAKKVIPGGNMLLSKRPEMFLPNRWPAYFQRASGCMVWDLDGLKYVDMSLMGVGTNILGYGRNEIDEAVIRNVRAGNMSSLNCPEEVSLAEKLIELHPWAEMVRFARTGGEANSIAVRIARAACGKDGIALCGYHGWHDWYLSANLSRNQSLDEHLLPGLEPAGVPKALVNTVHTFQYGKFDELLNIVESHEIGVIKLEVSRSTDPDLQFLRKVRDLATERGLVLVFDECTSGFREALGGLHLKCGVEPDIALFGKALGNGYAITACIGRREIMEAAQNTFISSTFWTERIGPTAALKTLEIMEREKSWMYITQTGLTIREKIQSLAADNSLTVEHWGLPALTGFTIKSKNPLVYKTLITQEMLKRGYLVGNSVYVCTEHTPEILGGFFESINEVFRLISDCEKSDCDPSTLLEVPVCHAGFKRLN